MNHRERELESLREFVALRTENLQTLRALLTPSVLDILSLAWEMWKEEEYRHDDFLQWCFQLRGYLPGALPPVL